MQLHPPVACPFIRQFAARLAVGNSINALVDMIRWMDVDGTVSELGLENLVLNDLG